MHQPRWSGESSTHQILTLDSEEGAGGEGSIMPRLGRIAAEVGPAGGMQPPDGVWPNGVFLVKLHGATGIPPAHAATATAAGAWASCSACPSGRSPGALF